MCRRFFEKKRRKGTMGQIKLNIYDDKKKIAKTLEVDGYDLMLGTVEDFMGVIDVDKIGDNMEVAKMVVKGYDQIKPLLMDVFPDLTDEDFRHIKVNELVQTIVQLGYAVVDTFKNLKTKN